MSIKMSNSCITKGAFFQMRVEVILKGVKAPVVHIHHLVTLYQRCRCQICLQVMILRDLFDAVFCLSMCMHDLHVFISTNIYIH